MGPKETTMRKRTTSPAPKILLTTEYEPEYVIRMPDGSALDLCDAAQIVTYHDKLLSLSATRQQKLGLHLMAANAGCPVTVLEHPTKEMFEQAVADGDYDYIGFNVLVPALERVEEMIKTCRRLSPKSEIILGGHGVEHPYAREIGADHVCRGEGMAFLHELLGTQTEQFRHPILPFRLNMKAFRGIPGSEALASEHIVVCLGAGCSAGCEYCPASSFYDRAVFDFLDADGLLENLFAIKEKHPNATVAFWDQDFLRDKKRAQRVGEAIAAYNRARTDGTGLITWTAQVSIQTVSRYDLDDLYRYGCRFLSIGIESSEERWSKRKGCDPQKLFAGLGKRGIGTFGFFILGWEHHDVARIESEADFLLSLEPTVSHFTLLTPEPGTKQYKRMEEEGRLLDLPPHCFSYASLQFDHPLVSAEQAQRAINDAYRRATETLGPWVLRAVELQCNGLRYARQTYGTTSPTALQFERNLRGLQPMLYLRRSLYPAGIATSMAKALRGELQSLGIRKTAKTLIRAGMLNTIISAAGTSWRLRGLRKDNWKPTITHYKNTDEDNVVVTPRCPPKVSRAAAACSGAA